MLLGTLSTCATNPTALCLPINILQVLDNNLVWFPNIITDDLSFLTSFFLNFIY